MTVEAAVIGAALFGSRARGDYHSGSDVDVLLWTEGGWPRAGTTCGVALAHYPRDMLLEMAARGDLFVGHLVTEAVALWDPKDLLSELRKAYVQPRDLSQVIANATDLGRLLLDRNRHFPPDLFNKRAAWVARTIMIARVAEEGELVFSMHRLTERLKSPEGQRLVNAKEDGQVCERHLETLSYFLAAHGDTTRLRANCWSFRDMFLKTDNQFGLKTLNQLEQLEPQTIYA